MLGSHIYYKNLFSTWQISGNDIKILIPKMLSYLVKKKKESPTDVPSKTWYTAISIKVVPKKREKVEYERERLTRKD